MLKHESHQSNDTDYQLLIDVLKKNECHYDSATGIISYGAVYGEQSYNGEPLNSSPLEEFFGSQTSSDPPFEVGSPGVERADQYLTAEKSKVTFGNKKLTDTQTLRPLNVGTSSSPYGTYITSRTRLLKSFMSDPDKPEIKPASQHAFEITLVIRGMSETFRMEDNQVILLGRSDFRAGGFQPDIDLSPYGAHELGVSRAHARLHVQDRKLFLTDLYSSNGTYISKRRLEPEKSHQIKSGDEFLVGALLIRAKIE